MCFETNPQLKQKYFRLFSFLVFYTIFMFVHSIIMFTKVYYCIKL